MSLVLSDALPASAFNCSTRELIFVEALAGSSVHTYFILQSGFLIHNMKQFLLPIIAFTSFGIATQARDTEPKATSELRDQAAERMVENHPNFLAFYTKGLVCSSCGIGLRIHTSKLDGVDKSQLTKGVDLDVENQLVLVAFKLDAAIDVDGVREAIYNAGYDPVSYYLWTEIGGITQTVYPVSEK